MEAELFKWLAASSDVVTIFFAWALFKIDRRLLALEYMRGLHNAEKEQ